MRHVSRQKLLIMVQTIIQPPGDPIVLKTK